MKNAGGATDRVAAEILTRIREGDYVPGQRLVEADLAKEFGVSRGVIRQTLHRLAAASIVDIALHRGATIHRLSRQELTEMYEIRQLLEGYAARKAAQSPDHAAIAERLSQLIDRMTPAANTHNVREFTTINADFHDLLLGASGNDYLARVLRQMHALLPRLIYSRLLDPQTMRASHEGHIRIARAIAAGDADAAERAMQAHVTESGEAIHRLADKFFARSQPDGSHTQAASGSPPSPPR